jgi:hypothetical protein
MMRYFFLFAWMLTGIFLPAQPPADSVTAGVVTVRRPPVKAAYTVKISYDYSSDWNKPRFWENSVKRFRRGYQAWLSNPFPPQPVSVAHNDGDTIRPADDSAAATTYYVRNDRPKEPFNFAAYLQAIGYEFEWSDSMKLDSARFEYFIDKKGRVKFRELPWEAKDSVNYAFQRKASPVMRKLWLWYPAQKISNRNSKLENIPCRVVVTVYAFDPGREIPFRVLTNNK